MRPYVLLIEDNLADAELTRAALGSSDLEVEFVHAYGAEEGLGLARGMLKRPETPPAALVLLDLGLPGVDGLGVLQEFKKSLDTAALPVVAFSGTRDPDVVRSALKGGANAFVHKADDLDVYFRRVSHVAETFLRHAASPLAD